MDLVYNFQDILDCMTSASKTWTDHTFSDAEEDGQGVHKRGGLQGSDMIMMISARRLVIDNPGDLQWGYLFTEKQC